MALRVFQGFPMGFMVVPGGFEGRLKSIPGVLRAPRRFQRRFRGVQKVSEVFQNISKILVF